MGFCPECKYEFVAGVETCPDCSIDLVDALPEEFHPDINWVELKSPIPSQYTGFIKCVGNIEITYHHVPWNPDTQTCTNNTRDGRRLPVTRVIHG